MGMGVLQLTIMLVVLMIVAAIGLVVFVVRNKK